MAQLFSLGIICTLMIFATIFYIVILVVAVSVIRQHLAKLKTKPPTTMILPRLGFFVVGLLFAAFAYCGVHFGEFQIRSGGRAYSSASSHFITAQNEPMTYWSMVIVFTLVSGVSLFCAFARGKHDA